MLVEMSCEETTNNFKYGDVREDGYVFIGYRKRTRKNGDVKIQADWYSPEAFRKYLDKKAEYKRRQYHKNPEKYKTEWARWKAENPQKMKSCVARWSKENRAYVNERKARRKAWKRQTATSLAPDERRLSRALYEASRRISECIGIAHHVDHIIPIAKGGGLITRRTSRYFLL